MLWIEITPKAAFTPHCSRKAATTAPTVTGWLLFVGLGMARKASGNVDVAACRVRRRAAKQGKGSRARLRSEAPDDPAGCVCSSRAGRLHAAQSSDLSSRASKRRRHWPDSTSPIRMPLTRTPCGANSVAMERTRFSTPARAAEVATMCGSGWRASSELAQTMAASPSTARCASCGRKARVGLITEKNFSLQLFGPGLVVGVGEGGDAALAGVVDQRGRPGRARPRWRRQRRAPRRRRARRKAAGEQPGFGCCWRAAPATACVQPLGIAAAQRDRRAAGQQQLDGG
jgi:hypothetical protein